MLHPISDWHHETQRRQRNGMLRRNEGSQVRKPLINQLLAYADKDVGEGNESHTEKNHTPSRATKRIVQENELHSE